MHNNNNEAESVPENASTTTESNSFSAVSEAFAAKTIDSSVVAPSQTYQNVYNISGTESFGSGFTFGAYDIVNRENMAPNATLAAAAEPPIKLNFPKKVVNQCKQMYM